MWFSDMPGARCLRIVLDRDPERRQLGERDHLRPEIRPLARRVFRPCQRDIAEPAGVGADVQEQGDVDHRAAEQQDPVVESSEAREGDLAGADHQRHEIDRHGLHHRHGEQEHHGRAVQAEQLIVEVGIDEGVLGACELDPHQHGQDAAEHEERERRRDEPLTDGLVIGRAEPADDAARHGPGPLQAQTLGRDVLVRGERLLHGSPSARSRGS
jgi:hypothetical protein